MTQTKPQNQSEVVAMPLPHGDAPIALAPGTKPDIEWPNTPDPPVSPPPAGAPPHSELTNPNPSIVPAPLPPQGQFSAPPQPPPIASHQPLRPPPLHSSTPHLGNRSMPSMGHAADQRPVPGPPPPPGPASAPPMTPPPIVLPPIPKAAGQADQESRRRSAGHARLPNEGAPSIGNLIFSLHQKPSRKPFVIAMAVSLVWVMLVVGAGYAILGPDARQAEGLVDFALRPAVMTIAGTTVVPVAVVWFLALLVWRAQELRLMSSAMTEVAVRLAEPDRMAEQSVASLGQSVRRQVSFMNDAIGRAIGRASELEALVHNEVAALERSYSENEYRIRSLIEELASERAALTNNSVRVSESLSGIGAKVTREIADASRQATEQLTQASHNIGQLIETRASAITTSANQAANLVDERLSERGNSLLSSLSVMTQRIGTEVPVIIERMSQEQVRLTKIIEQAGGNLSALEQALAMRTQALGTVLEDNTKTMDRVLTERSETLQTAFGKGLQSLDKAFDHGLQSVDQSMLRGAQAFDTSVSQRTLALAAAMESHAQVLGESLSKKSSDLDQTLARGIEAVRRSSDTITRQSIKTIDGLASQAALLKDVSENLLGQINTLTNRFENQGQTIMKAAHALETSNMKVDSVLQERHSELSELLEKMNDRARSFDHAARDYTATVGNSLTEVERRALQTTQEIARSTQLRSSEAMAELERFKSTTENEAARMLGDLTSRLSVISSEVTSQLGSVSTRVNETSDEMRSRALHAADELETMQVRLRDQMQSLPETSKTSAEQIRRALQDQLAALEQLTAIAGRQAARQDVAVPDRASLGSLTQAFTSRLREAAPPAPPAPGRPPGQATSQGSLNAAAAAVAASNRERTGWSLGDLLDRASRDEGGEHRPANPARAAASGTPGNPANRGHALNVGNIARAIDPVTAADIWTRVRAGQRGILNRELYTPEGQSTFDEISHRYHGDSTFQDSVNRYLGDFERLLTDAEAREPGGRIAENYLISDTGRVYLLLAHASGRLA